MTTFLLIRHAHVDTGPPPGVLCGTLDLPLSERGRAQIEALRSRIEAWQPDALYTSSLARARETAAALTEAWRLDATPERALREIHCGRLEGLSIADIERDYREIWNRNLAQQDDEFAWPDGESYREFRTRVLGGLSAIAAKHPGGRVAVVTHAGVISQTLGALRGRPPAVWDADRPDPLTVTEIGWANGHPASLVAFNRRICS